ncbi:MAG: sulfoxide reductase heme-binding subunit YedZ [Gammaproteobacteria bacterium]|nr:sulfoxide reductase heme-binding subunit YedZ [Gammaproteobacteria bacterium]
MSLAAVLKSTYAKPVAHLLCLAPLCLLLVTAFNDALGANPVEKLTHETGEWTLRLLLVTLSLSPLRQWTNEAGWIRFRRILGLYGYFYCCCHFSIWFIADHSFDPGSMIEDIVKRPYITLGFSAFLLLLPLALTSNQTMIRRLGKKWKSLHQLVYLVLVLGVLHFILQVKTDYLESGIYAIIAMILLIHRVGPIKRFKLKSSTVTR